MTKQIPFKSRHDKHNSYFAKQVLSATEYHIIKKNERTLKTHTTSINQSIQNSFSIICASYDIFKPLKFMKKHMLTKKINAIKSVPYRHLDTS